MVAAESLASKARPAGIVRPPSPPDDEHLLLEGLRTGDRASYERLVSAYGGRMFAVARRLLRDDDSAHDAVQEAFLNAFRSVGSFRAGARLSTWLHRIVVNAALMMLRARGRRPEDSIEELLPKFLEDGHRASPGGAWPEHPEEAVGQSEVRRLVRQAIDLLPDGYRTILLLRDIEELDTDETAALLGITPNAVKVRRHRARQALRELLDRRFGRELGS